MGLFFPPKTLLPRFWKNLPELPFCLNGSAKKTSSQYTAYSARESKTVLFWFLRFPDYVKVKVSH